jgi:hypothetical protein
MTFIPHILHYPSVGELGKNLSPSKRRSYRIRKYIRELASGWKVLFREKGNTHEEILMNFIHFADLLMICENNS